MKNYTPLNTEDFILEQERRRKKKRTIIFVIIGVVVFLAIIGNALNREDAETPTASQNDTTTYVAGIKGNTTNAITTEPITPFEARTIIDDYKDNEVRADTKYKDKIVYVTGIVANVGKDIFDKVYITIGTGEDFEVNQIQVYLSDKNEIAKAANVNTGTQITVSGKCNGLSVFNISLVDGKIY